MASQPEPALAPQVEPKAAIAAPKTAPKGVVPGRATVIKRADPAFIAQWKKPAPAGQIDISAQQPFQGDQPAPPTKASKPAKVVSKAPIKRDVKKTNDLRERERPLQLAPQNLEDLPSVLKEYHVRQGEIESNNPYMTDTAIYTPQSRKSFYRFISDNYSEVFRLPYAEKGKAIDQDACAKLEQAEGKQVEAFLYQKFIREYIRNAGPYRGILVYHGLGSGKTCSAIAAAEAIYGTSNKKIIVMTPFSLRANFMSEISFCGFRHFNIYNHWVKVPLTPYGTPLFTYATSVLSMRQEYLSKKVLTRTDPERRAIWVPDFTKESNYNELTQEERNDVREQLTHMIDSRIKFISYNGVSAAELKRYACLPDPDTGKPMFDDKVVVIDEIHNLIRLMQGQIMPYITEREGMRRKIEAEPIVPGRWEPKLCGKSENYKRAYLFYRLLTDARNTKIIGLSGTPIINFPEELGILANVLSGYTECAEFSLLSTQKEMMQKVKEIAEQEPRVDIVRFREGNQKMGVLISVFQEGYERVMDGEAKFIGVKYNEEAQDSIREIYPRIKAKLREANIKIEEDPKKGPFVSYPRLPIDDETFKREFIHPTNYSIVNKVVLQKRLAGLISYYKGSKEEFMPRVVRDEIVRCDMSDYVLMEKYTQERKKEIEGETNKEKGGDDLFASVEMFAKMKNPSSYRFRSRALCNFAFPKDIERPFPGTKEEEKEEEKLIDVIAENASEEIADTDADRAAAEKIAEEEREADELLAVMTELDTAASSVAQAEESADPAIERAVVFLKNERVKARTMARKIDFLKKQGLSVDNMVEAFKQAYPESDDWKGVAVQAEQAVMKGGDESDEDDEEEDEEEEEDDDEDYEDEDEEDEDYEDEDEQSSSDEEIEDIDESLEEMEGGAGDEVPKKRGPKVAPRIVPVAPAVAAEAAPIEVPIEVPVEAPILPAAVPIDAPAPVKRRGPRVAPRVAPAPIAAVEEHVMEEEDKAVPRVMTYKERIDRAMKQLDDARARYLTLESDSIEGRLASYSTKLDKMLRNIERSKGSNLVYSQFKTVEGLGVLGIALKANGYDEIKIVGTDLNPRFSDETIASFREGLGDVDRPKKKRFISFTGEGSKERRALVLNIFNGNLDKLPAEMRTVLEPFAAKKNTTGDICWVIGITGAGAEGISLKCCRSVHIMEPYWNNVRLDQVKGRAIRICSHKDLPFKEREVELYTYYTVFSEEQKRKDKIDPVIRTTDRSETSDEKVFYVSVRKDKINQELLKIMKESAVDCELNAGDNDGIQCFRVEGQATQYLFDPNLDVDKIVTSIELKEVRGDRDARVSRALDVSAPSESSMVDRVKVVRIKGVEYLQRVKPESSGTIFELFGRTDVEFRKPLGEVEVDPVLGKYIRFRMYM